MKKFVVISSLLCALFIACKPNTDSASSESIMYEPTPLALLMLRMHGDALAWKGALENDNFNAEFSEDYYGIYTVEATDPKVRNDVFTEKADIYMSSVKDLFEVEKYKKQIKKYNLMISSCVECHEVFCQGPIDKIEKLYIE